MGRAVRDVREAVAGADDSGSDTSAAEVLTAFVDAARGADSYGGALRAVLASVCEELHVESAALLERRDGSTPEYRCLVAAGALETAAPVVAADGFLITRLRAYPLPLPFAPNELDALAEWAAVHRPERLDEIRALAAAEEATSATTAVDAANGSNPKLATSRNRTSSQTLPTSAIDPTATPASESFNPPPRTSPTRSR